MRTKEVQVKKKLYLEIILKTALTVGLHMNYECEVQTSKSYDQDHFLLQLNMQYVILVNLDNVVLCCKNIMRQMILRSLSREDIAGQPDHPLGLLLQPTASHLISSVFTGGLHAT